MNFNILRSISADQNGVKYAPDLAKPNNSNIVLVPVLRAAAPLKKYTYEEFSIVVKYIRLFKSN